MNDTKNVAFNLAMHILERIPAPFTTDDVFALAERIYQYIKA